MRQCDLLGLARSSYYYRSVGEDPYNLLLMRLLDEQYTRTPFYGSPKMTDWLRKQGHPVNHKRVERIMRTMGLQAIYPKPRTSVPATGHAVYPYLLRGIRAGRPDHIWSCDITYIRMDGGFVYLMAVMDWYSRYVLSWSLSTTMEVDFCLEALEEALRRSRPDIFNSDQGSQFTCDAFTDRLKAADVRISMDGLGPLARRSTTSSWNGCGGRSNMRRSISSRIPVSAKPGAVWEPTCASIMRSAPISRWITVRQPACTTVHGLKRNVTVHAFSDIRIYRIRTDSRGELLGRSSRPAAC